MNRRAFSIAVVGLTLAGASVASPALADDVRNVVVVHGAFADGSGWRSVSNILTGKGYTVTIVQQPLTSLADDVAATRRVLALQNGRSILVGHSHGGMVISDAGRDDRVAGLVYVAAFQPEKGESLVKLAESRPVPDARPDSVRATPDGFLYFAPEYMPQGFAADLPQADAAFIARSQVFASQRAFTAEAGEPAWRTKPSWALVATQDRAINPVLEREMARRAGSQIREVEASHAVYASKPEEVARLIIEAAESFSK